MEKDNKKYPSLNLPPVALRMKVEDGLPKVFDPFREKYVAFTPEENVRQHFAAWLRDNYHYPLSLMRSA